MSFAKELKKDLNHIINVVKGLYSISISDKEGTPIITALNEFVQDYSLRPNVLANTGITSEQASKLELGKCKSITCLYDKHQFIHFIKDPIIITLIASSDCNTGLLLGLEPQFEPILQSLSKIVNINIVSPIYGKE